MSGFEIEKYFLLLLLGRRWWGGGGVGAVVCLYMTSIKHYG